MQKLDDLFIAPAPAESPDVPWTDEVGDLLGRAASLCIEHGLDCDAFMKNAWSAYIDSRPGLRAYLEEMQLRHQLEELRKMGKLEAA